jgi:hypothetical protein
MGFYGSPGGIAEIHKSALYSHDTLEMDAKRGSGAGLSSV